MHALKPLLLGTALAVAAIAPNTGMAEMDKPIGAIDVSADFSAFEGANALEFYPNLPSDLATELGAVLADHIARDGGRLEVIVSEVSVDGQPVLQPGEPFNRMAAGILYHTPTMAGGDERAGDIPQTGSASVQAKVDLSSLPQDGTAYILRPVTDDDMYDALIAGLAREIADEFADM